MAQEIGVSVNVKEQLYNNVRGRIREILWNDIKEAFDVYERNNNPDNRGKIKALYDITKELYTEYEPLLKEMEKDETAED